ncbi:MAG: Holliday junction resolvase RuvX [candidate division Zixibacteria bacterium]|nr:Holliday junction resolvase RuvX [candidate division Zixibacteria bacterium]
MEETRFIGIDLGRRRVGLALSDPSGTIAAPIGTLLVTGMNDALKKVLAAVAEHHPTGIVLGMPTHLSGRSSEIGEAVHKFARKLETATGLPIYFEDERYSSQEAEAVLHELGKKIKGNKERIDRIAAAIFLQSFLDRRRTYNTDGTGE